MKTSFEVVGELTMTNIHLSDLNKQHESMLSNQAFMANAAIRRLDAAVALLDALMSTPIRARKNDDLLRVKDNIEQALKSVNSVKEPQLPF